VTFPNLEVHFEDFKVNFRKSESSVGRLQRKLTEPKLQHLNIQFYLLKPPADVLYFSGKFRHFQIGLFVFFGEVGAFLNGIGVFFGSIAQVCPLRGV